MKTLFLFNFIQLFFFTNGLISNSTSRQRIFCVIKTFGGNLATRASTVHQTWASRCDKHVFLTAANLTKWNNTVLPILNLHDVSDNYMELSVKVFDALNQIIQEPQPYDFDWLFMADDDTYVIMEHLRELLQHIRKPLAFGHLFVPKNQAPGHLSGGAGYAINTAALRRMLPNLQTSCADWYVPGMEDVYVSRCLQHLNVSLDGAIDGYRHRFYPLEFITMYKMELPKWFSDYNSLQSYPGFDCCSANSISFHYMKREWMHLIEWARYLHADD
ncbi:unnamed protein product [Rotaria magnacalcarata]|uniref:N-acetylgalactosaminide beta-1,3-galactosyltransferase n=3 Tax=Rotaria magnacalcarata TaxID=392030 RepID=A0A815L2T6_9BILA|nr:unnamed protein product [Rotaria magnacalcarata]CAF2050344.1 unnamed protein product [Rotaria magnacalcarata]